MMNKRWGIFLIISVVTAMFFAGCASSDGVQESGKVNVVTTFYPLYDFAEKIGGDHIHVIQLVPTGVDPHDWAPNPQDMVNVTQSDLFIYNGAGFEMWIEPFLQHLDDNTIVVEASRGVDLIQFADGHGDYEDHSDHEDHSDREQERDDHAHDHDHDDLDDHIHGHDHGHSHHHGEFDPHIWLSPKRAKAIADNILAGLVTVDEDNRAHYETNHAQLIEQLSRLDNEFHEVVERGNRDHIVVSHNAFAYLAHDYGFRQLSVMGLSPEAEPTPGQLKTIAEFIREHDVQYILFEELVSPRVAEMLAQDLGIETLVFNPLEGLTDEQIANGEDYFSLMEKNLLSLAKALE